MLKPILITPPDEAAPLLTLAEAKQQLRVDDGDVDENDLIAEYVSAASAWLDGYQGVLGLALRQQTWRIKLQDWCSPIRLPISPVRSISSISYFDNLNVERTAADTNYSLQEDALSPYVSWIWQFNFPSLYERDDAVAIDFVAGLEANHPKIKVAKQLLRLLVANSYENREPINVGHIVNELPMAAQSLIRSLKRPLV